MIFLASLFVGVGWPLLPIIAEWGLTGSIQPENYALTAIVYVAAVGLASRRQDVAISSFFCSTIAALIYGGLKVSGNSAPGAPFVQYASLISGFLIATYVGCWCVERFGRHWIDREPLLEFS